MRNPALGLEADIVGTAAQSNMRAERRAIIALFAVFALLVQAMFPTFATAGAMSGPGVTICTDMGLAPAPANDAGAPMERPHGCDHCLTACAAPALPASPSALVQPVVYTAPAATPTPVVYAVRPGRGLAAPPPPSRGPPSSEA
ncbi:MAG: DUF2946 family protein [Phenylobacterium sp.]|uniref:DUF2946 family protein n=1 Tax=Phenylobacterium sp. TaxID=1871053 RepID=UPI001A45C1B9|nr:DUF2946 family protein [Phenylobacterium sp.]MBL8772553.1 DUF2946 family protein [Phenylobacterium sp.]